MQNPEIPIAKKRGRKPKGAVPIEQQQAPQAQPTHQIVDSDAIIVHKKRGRKPKQKDLAVEQPSIVKPLQIKKNENSAIVVNKLDNTAKQPLDSLIPDNIIVHLPISHENIESIINDSTQVIVNESNYEHNSTWFSSFETANEHQSVVQSDDFNTRLEHLIESRKTDFDISKSKNAGIRKPTEYTMSQFYECNKKKYGLIKRIYNV